MVAGSGVDFLLIRDTMYKYSKKAEDRYFSDPCMAFLFLKFASSQSGKQYIENKLSKSTHFLISPDSDE